MIQRLKISIDVGADTTIIHGDVKPSNIILDHDMTACIAHFGLAKMVSGLVSANESSSSFGIKVTIGYVAPEYATSKLVSTQGDVYSYGILLLEIITDRKPTDEEFKDHVNLHSVVTNTWPDDVMKIVDLVLYTRNYANNKIKDCTASILKIGVACSSTVPRDRMSMNDVVNELCKIRDYLLDERRNELKLHLHRALKYTYISLFRVCLQFFFWSTKIFDDILEKFANFLKILLDG